MQRPADLVLGGGGIRCIAHVGALAALEDAGYVFRRVAGTSAGAVVGALAVAGMRSGEMRRLVRDLDPRVFRDGGRLSRLGSPGKGLSVLRRQGVYEGDALHRWLTSVLEGLGVRTFADLRIDDDRASHLPPERAYRLVVIAFDATLGRLVRLPWDYGAYGLDPDGQPVADALRASCSIPVFYRPATLVPGCGGGANRLVDAGFLSTIPVDVFDRDDGLPPRWPTFGLRLTARPHAAAAQDRAGPLRGLLGMLRAHDRWELDKADAAARTVWLETGEVRATDFGLDTLARQRLLEHGESATARFLSAWDHEAYRRRFRRAEAAAGPHAAPGPAAAARITVAGGAS